MTARKNPDALRLRVLKLEGQTAAAATSRNHMLTRITALERQTSHLHQFLSEIGDDLREAAKKQLDEHANQINQTPPAEPDYDAKADELKRILSKAKPCQDTWGRVFADGTLAVEGADAWSPKHLLSGKVQRSGKCVREGKMAWSEPAERCYPTAKQANEKSQL